MKPFLNLFLPKNNKKQPPIGDCLSLSKAPPGIEPGNKSFADFCLTAWLWAKSQGNTLVFQVYAVSRKYVGNQIGNQMWFVFFT